MKTNTNNTPAPAGVSVTAIAAEAVSNISNAAAQQTDAGLQDAAPAAAIHDSTDTENNATVGTVSAIDEDETATGNVGSEALTAADARRDENSNHRQAPMQHDDIDMITNRLQVLLERIRELEQEYDRKIGTVRHKSYLEGRREAIDDTLRATAPYTSLRPVQPSTTAPADFLARDRHGFWD